MSALRKASVAAMLALALMFGFTAPAASAAPAQAMAPAVASASAIQSATVGFQALWPTQYCYITLPALGDGARLRAGAFWYNGNYRGVTYWAVSAYTYNGRNVYVEVRQYSGGGSTVLARVGWSYTSVRISAACLPRYV